MTNEDFMIQTAEYLNQVTGIPTKHTYDFIDYFGIGSYADLCAAYPGHEHKECLMFLENDLRSFPWDLDVSDQFADDTFDAWLARTEAQT